MIQAVQFMECRCAMWEGKRTVVFKRSLAVDMVIDNPLFYHERSRMLLGDASEC